MKVRDDESSEIIELPHLSCSSGNAAAGTVRLSTEEETVEI